MKDKKVGKEYDVFTLFYVAWIWYALALFLFGDKGMAFFGNGVFFFHVYQSVGNQRFSG
jgi:hypothetical protein